MIEKLKPCPFSHDLLPEAVESFKHGAGVGIDASGYGISVVCVICGTRGPAHETESEAVAAWNRRASQGEPKKMIAFVDHGPRTSLAAALMAQREPQAGASADVEALVERLAGEYCLWDNYDGKRPAHWRDDETTLDRCLCTGGPEWHYDQARWWIGALRSRAGVGEDTVTRALAGFLYDEVNIARGRGRRLLDDDLRPLAQHVVARLSGDDQGEGV